MHLWLFECIDCKGTRTRDPRDVRNLDHVIQNEFPCRTPVFGASYADGDVIQSLLGNQPLPWEMDAGLFDLIPNKDARNLIKNLLRRDS